MALRKEPQQKSLFKQERLRRNDGRFCTAEQRRVEMVDYENKLLRHERDKYFRMYVALEKANERLTRELMVIKSKIKDLM